MRIAEYKRIDTRIETEVITVNDYDADDNVIGQHSETVTREIPVMGMVYRDATPEEEAEAARQQAEIEAEEANREPTFEERMEAQVMYTALVTDTLIEEV